MPSEIHLATTNLNLLCNSIVDRIHHPCIRSMCLAMCPHRKPSRPCLRLMDTLKMNQPSTAIDQNIERNHPEVEGDTIW